MSDALGYAAAVVVLASFLMRSMVSLRLVAILSNVLFLSYGYLADIHPVFLLHAALLPINIARLVAHRGDSILDRLSRIRYRAPASDRFRHISLFILGLTAGSLGLRALLHVVFLLFNQYRRSRV